MADPMYILPLEISFNILSLLSPKEILSAKRVCKLWKMQIEHAITENYLVAHFGWTSITKLYRTEGNRTWPERALRANYVAQCRRLNAAPSSMKTVTNVYCWEFATSQTFFWIDTKHCYLRAIYLTPMDSSFNVPICACCKKPELGSIRRWKLQSILGTRDIKPVVTNLISIPSQPTRIILIWHYEVKTSGLYRDFASCVDTRGGKVIRIWSSELNMIHPSGSFKSCHLIGSRKLYLFMDSDSIDQTYLVVFDCDNGLELERNAIGFQLPTPPETEERVQSILSPDEKYIALTYSDDLWIYKTETRSFQHLDDGILLSWRSQDSRILQFRENQLHIVEHDVWSPHFFVFELDCENGFDLTRIRNYYCLGTENISLYSALRDLPSEGISSEIALIPGQEMVENRIFMSPSKLFEDGSGSISRFIELTKCIRKIGHRSRVLDLIRSGFKSVLNMRSNILGSPGKFLEEWIRNILTDQDVRLRRFTATPRVDLFQIGPISESTMCIPQGIYDVDIWTITDRNGYLFTENPCLDTINIYDFGPQDW
ncbi:hypothetical protein TWF106_010698 [Orbilia oligospora]|uniref:F-box domain-containing protein n=1 Tax=Orbilia oligospora TaxID=2813651 RepID=A0A7C8QG34_ORBOL|nr:hypothetical protein TWF106_010698 [Orbilia oligospora]